jgi:hypothetical protein
MDNDVDWAKTCHSRPSEEGYYQTLYWNERLEQWLYKALWYSPIDMKWSGPWHWSYDRIGPFYASEEYPEYWKIVHKGLLVDRYVPSSRTRFYGEQFKT